MRPQKITFGEMREGRDGTRRILVYCADYRCSHLIAMSADQWVDDVRLSDIEPRFYLPGMRQARRRRAATLSAGTDGDARANGKD